MRQWVCYTSLFQIPQESPRVKHELKSLKVPNAYFQHNFIISKERSVSNLWK